MRIPRWSPTALLGRTHGLLLLLATIGCADTAPSPAQPPPADSAGIPVVVNPEAALDRVPEWRIDPEPILTVGQVDGPEEYLLGRVQDATLLSDRTLVLTDLASQQVRFYGPDGRHLRSVGGRGGGLGEFESLLAVRRLLGDSVLALEGFGSRRAMVFDRAGTFERTYTLEPFGVYPLLVGVLSDGHVIQSSQAVGSPGGRTEFAVRITSPDGRSAVELGEFPGVEAASTGGLLPFGRAFHAHASGDVIALGNSDTFSIRIYDGAGSVVRVVRLETEGRPLTNEHRARLRDDAVDFIPPERRADWESMLRESERYTTFSAFADLRVDRGGNLWVQTDAWPGPEQTEATDWVVFDPAGVVTATITIPPGLMISDIGEDYIVEVGWGEFDIAVVRVYRVAKP